ncbi:hypothetical protein GOP47_0003186 [Adiantum capillus-veneris]|uniref:BHLH domain-containing protein n=1 Tax=Adiantum capillus-veneris TaxID=13818 RepID=A0A9D4VBZ2_ADICA|nr:hypothetical protein GOP47_0003186 [Adiantum capillus-veneris]
MCQVSLVESHNIAEDQDHQQQLMVTSKEAPSAAPLPVPLPLSSPSAPRTDSALDSNKSPCLSDDNPTSKAHLNVGDHDHPPAPLNFISSCSQEDEPDCSPGSPEFFLPANAYISLDDPSSLLTSCYTSPSDPNSMIWPNPISPSTTALLNCPSIFSAGTSSDEGSISCEEIPSHVDINPQILHYPSNNIGSFPDGALSYSALLQSHYHPSLASPFHSNNTQQSNFNGFNQMMQLGASNHPYCSGSSPFAAFGQGRTYSAHAAPYRMMPNVFAADTRAGMLEQCLNEAQHEQEEQSWYTFLQPAQEDRYDAGCLEKVEAINCNTASLRLGSTSNMMMMPTDFQHHHHYKQGMYIANAHLQTMEKSASARSPTNSHLMMESMQLQNRSHADGAAASCCTHSSKNKRVAPDGEDSWPPAEANYACSPPLKMQKSPSFSSSTTRPSQVTQANQMHNANQTHTDDYASFGAEKYASTLSPTKQCNTPTNSMTGSPTVSNNQLIDQQPAQRSKPAKSSTRQSVCNDPQSVAARHRRERISERLKTLQQLVPNGAKVDLVTMLEKAISYVKSLQLQVKVLSTDEYWPTPLSDKYSLTNLAVVAKLAASTYN